MHMYICVKCVCIHVHTFMYECMCAHAYVYSYGIISCNCKVLCFVNIAIFLKCDSNVGVGFEMNMA